MRPFLCWRSHFTFAPYEHQPKKIEAARFYVYARGMKRNALLLALLPAFVAVQLLFVWAYLTHEKTPHFWDYAMYASMAIGLFAQESLGATWAVFRESFARDYNLLFALPSQIGFALFGPNRTVFILTNAAIFLTLHQVALAFVLKSVFRLSFLRALGAALLGSALIPFLWYPLLQGYPDNGAAAALMFALGLGLRKRRDWAYALLLGALVGLAILLRRHYAYPGLALLAVLALADALPALRQTGRERLKSLGGAFGHAFWAGASALGLLVLTEPVYMREMVLTDFISLYKSYERPAPYFLLFALDRVGPLLFAGVCGGGLLAWRARPGSRREIAIVSGFTALWLVLWCLGPAQAGEHYLISVLPLFCLVGLYGLFSAARGRALLAFLVILFAANSVQAFWPRPLTALPSDPPRLGLLSEPRPPWVRTDYDVLKELALHIAQTTSDDDKIVVAASSFILNHNILQALYLGELRDVRPALRLVRAPEIDGKEPPPFDVYALANVYVVPEPPQYHLDPAGQKVVTALAGVFPPGPVASSLFRKDPLAFELMRGVKVSLWRREPWTPAGLIEGVQKMAALAGGAQDWLPVASGAGSRLVDLPTEPTQILGELSSRARAARYLFAQPLKAGRYRLAMQLDAQSACQNLAVAALLKNPLGATASTQALSPTVIPGPLYLPFEVEAAPYLELEIRAEPQSPCRFLLSGLRLESFGLPNRSRSD